MTSTGVMADRVWWETTTPPIIRKGVGYAGAVSYTHLSWQVTSPQVPNYVGTASGNAFERVNIPLWKLEEGIYDLEIKAITESGLSDGIRRTIYVTDTYHEIEEAVTEILKPNMQLAGGKDGLTTLIFTDSGRGRFKMCIRDSIQRRRASFWRYL